MAVAASGPARLGCLLLVLLPAAAVADPIHTVAARWLDEPSAGGTAPGAPLGGWAGTATTLPLPELLASAVRNSPDLASATLDLEIARAQHHAALGLDDWRLAGDFSVQSSAGSFGGISLGRQIEVSVGSELTRPLRSGGAVSVGAGIRFSDVDSDTDALDSREWTTDVSAAISHPLLRGRGQAIARASQVRATIAQDRVSLAIRQTAIAVIHPIVAAYWDLALAEREVEIRRATLELARQRHRVTEAGISGGKIAPSEILAVEQIIATREEELVATEIAVVERSLTLRRAAALPIGPDAIAMSAGNPGLDAPADLTLSSVLETAYQTSPELAQLALSERDATIEIELSRNGLLPQLDAALRLGPSGRDDTVGGSAKNLVTFDDFTVVGQLTLSHDLGRRGATGATREARLRREKVRVTATDVRAQIAESATRALAQMELARRRQDLSRRDIELAQRNVAVEQARFDLGKATSFDVLARQDELGQAQLRYARAQIDRKKAHAAALAVSGAILEAHGITLAATGPAAAKSH